MKDWVKKLDFNSISALAKKKWILDDIPDEVDERILRTIGEKGEAPKKNLFTNPLISYALTAAVLILILVPVLLFLGSQKEALLSEIVLSSGSSYLIREGIEQVVTASTKPQQGDIFYTKELSKQLLQFGENSLVQLSEKTRLTLLELNKNEVKISLELGSIFGRINNETQSDIQMSVVAHGVSLYSSDSVFSIGTFGTTNKIIVYKGSVYGEIKKANGMEENFRMSQGEQLLVESEPPVKSQLQDSELQSAFSDFLKFNPGKRPKSPARLSLSIPMESVLLKINDSPVDFFSYNISINLEAGDFYLVLEKDGYYPQNLDITLAENETRLIVVPELIKNEKDVHNAPSANSSLWLEQLKADVVYSYGQNNSGNRRFLGFNSNGRILVGVTKFSVICVNQDGELIWEKDFSKGNDIIFDTIPLIYNEKIYIPANYKILVLDTKTGRELNSLKAPGIVSYGYQMITNQDKGYIPYPEGIYVLDLSDYSISETPFIAFENPSTPLFFKGNFYVSSFFKGEIALYDFSGNKKAEVPLDAISLSSPVAGSDQIFLGDMLGNLYRFDESLKISEAYQLGNGITAILCTDNIILALTNNGELLSFSVSTFKKINSLILDHKPDKMNYLYKKPVGINKYVVIGSETGRVLFISSETAELVKSIKVIDSAISTSFISLGKSIFAGTKDGSLIRLK